MEIGEGAVIMMGAILNIGAVVGERSMIDMGAVLGGRATVGKRYCSEEHPKPGFRITVLAVDPSEVAP